VLKGVLTVKPLEVLFLTETNAAWLGVATISDASCGDRVFTPQPGHEAADAVRAYNFAP
jgi:hypothetical protein